MSTVGRAGRGRLEGKGALITGGTRGIGLAVARHFCEEGASVVICGRDPLTGGAALEELRAAGHIAWFMPADVSNVGQIKSLVEGAIEHLGAIDVLVNNAGVLYGNRLLDVTEEAWDKAHAVNLKSAVFCTQAVARHMLETGRGGSIINTTSVAGRIAKLGQVEYAVSKAGLSAFTRQAARELAPDIRVNAIAPGFFITDMTRGASPAQSASIVANTLMERPGELDELTELYVLLASGAASFVTSQEIGVDGGRIFER